MRWLWITLASFVPLVVIMVTTGWRSRAIATSELVDTVLAAQKAGQLRIERTPESVLLDVGIETSERGLFHLQWADFVQISWWIWLPVCFGVAAGLSWLLDRFLLRS